MLQVGWEWAAGRRSRSRCSASGRECRIRSSSSFSPGCSRRSARENLEDEHYERAIGRVPLLTYGANSSPERLALKLAHLPAGDREALILAGDLEGFDVGAAAHPPVWSSMPATLISSPGTAVRVAVLFLTPMQFTALWWTELSYKVGALTGITLVTDVSDEPIKRVILFVSRFGAFCIDGAPVAMDAIPARNRRFTPLTQTEILNAAARMSIGALPHAT